MAWSWFDNDSLSGPGLNTIRAHSFSCAGCGFVSRPSRQVPHGYMVPVDRSHHGFADITGTGECLCPLCASSLAINWSVAGIVQDDRVVVSPGMLIYQPSMSQVEINRIALNVISILAAQPDENVSKMQSAARDIDAAMRALNQEVGLAIPFYRGKDSDFARALALLPDEFYSHRETILGVLRWWPDVRYWKQQGSYWMQSTYQKLNADNLALQEALK